MKDNGKAKEIIVEKFGKATKRKEELIAMLKVNSDEGLNNILQKELEGCAANQLIYDNIISSWNKESCRGIKSSDSKCNTYPFEIDYSGDNISIVSEPHIIKLSASANQKLLINRIEWGIITNPGLVDALKNPDIMDKELKQMEFNFYPEKEQEILTIKGNVQKSALPFGVALTSKETEVIEINENKTFEMCIAIPQVKGEALKEHLIFKGEIKVYFEEVTLED